MISHKIDTIMKSTLTLKKRAYASRRVEAVFDDLDASDDDVNEDLETSVQDIEANAGNINDVSIVNDDSNEDIEEVVPESNLDTNESDKKDRHTNKKSKHISTNIGKQRNKPPIRKKNKETRTREFLTESEVKSLQKAANKGKFGLRNSTMIMMAFRHGFRVSELITLKWEQIDLASGQLFVRRLKNGIDATHPLGAAELRALARLKREQGESGGGYVFSSVQGVPMTPSNVRKILDATCDNTDIDMKIHPHMLRHACGHYLANKGQDTRSIQVYMGHANIQNTTLYTDISSDRFKNFFND